MKIVAHVVDCNCSCAPSEDKTALTLRYSCGDRRLTEELFLIVDLLRTESEIKDDIREAVAADSNSKCELQVTAADVRLL